MAQPRWMLGLTAVLVVGTITFLLATRPREMQVAQDTLLGAADQLLDTIDHAIDAVVDQVGQVVEDAGNAWAHGDDGGANDYTGKASTWVGEGHNVTVWVLAPRAVATSATLIAQLTAQLRLQHAAAGGGGQLTVLVRPLEGHDDDEHDKLAAAAENVQGGGDTTPGSVAAKGLVAGVVVLMPDLFNGQAVHCAVDVVGCAAEHSAAAVRVQEHLQLLSKRQANALPWCIVVSSADQNVVRPPFAEIKPLVGVLLNAMVGTLYGEPDDVLASAVPGSLPWVMVQIANDLPVVVDLERGSSLQTAKDKEMALDLVFVDDVARIIARSAVGISDRDRTTLSIHSPQTATYHDVVSYLIDLTKSKSPLQSFRGGPALAFRGVGVLPADTMAIGEMTTWQQGILEHLRRLYQLGIAYQKGAHRENCEPLPEERLQKWNDTLDGW